MADVLARIIERKRSEVAARLGGSRIDAVPTTRSLRQALVKPGARFIMEVKRASPSGHRSKATLKQALTAYAPMADAVSVLTDGPDFGGSLDDLREARRLFPGPILAKDFIVDAAQIREARAAGADAILVMLSVLGNHRAAEMMAEARRLNMDAVVEVHDEVELARALALGAGIIGINNRNLRTLATDLGATEQLAPLVPADVTLVSESGIASRRDVVRLGGHADAFLVGSSLMAAPDIGEAAKALVHGRVKICGLTNAQDVAEAARHGATHAGFIMVPGTPRAVTADAATALAGNARASGMKTVAVFRDEPLDEVARLSDRLQLDAVQLHGRESAAALAELRSRLPLHTEMWAVCRVGRQAQGPRAGADRTLFDTVARGRSGGTGVAFDWSLVEDRQDLRHGFLAGGIGPDNAPAAARTGAFGLDVGSRIESVPGRKDPAKMRALFEALRPDCRRAA